MKVVALVAAVALAAATAITLSAPALAAAPRADAPAYLVVNGATGETLVRHGEQRRLPMASITKLMTVLVALRRTRLDEVVTVDAEAAGVGESGVALQPGERLTVHDLVEAALIQSANDAAFALAAHVGRGNVERFVALMNAEARRLGLDETHFERPDGLDVPGHVSSARDVTRLAQLAMRHRAVRTIVRQRTETIAGGRTVYTWNDLLGTFPGTIGVKTGHTFAAGWCQVAAARRGPVTVYATILGSPSREQRNADLVRLLSWGLSRYRSVTLATSGQVFASTAMSYDRGSLPLAAERSLVRVVRVDRPLVQRVVTPAGIGLPVERGERLGTLRVYRGSRLVASTPLVATRSVSKPSFPGRVRWYAGRTLDHVRGWFT